MESEQTLMLSDSFPEGSSSDIEVRVRMININPGHNPQLMQDCAPLREYSWTTERIRENMKVTDVTQAVDEAIESMPDSFVIKPYLLAHKAEVKDMLLTEYNEVEAMELFRKEGLAEGRADGLVEGRTENLVENLASVMKSLGCTFERACEILRVPAEEREGYLARLHEVQSD